MAGDADWRGCEGGESWEGNLKYTPARYFGFNGRGGRVAVVCPVCMYVLISSGSSGKSCPLPNKFLGLSRETLTGGSVTVVSVAPGPGVHLVSSGKWGCREMQGVLRGGAHCKCKDGCMPGDPRTGV